MRLLSLGLFVCAIGHRTAEFGAAELEDGEAPSGITNLDVGVKGSGPLVPQLVPPAGTTYEFKVGQYKDKPHQKMEYDWVLHKVNNEVVDKRFAWSKGDSVYTMDNHPKWRIRRRFGAAAWAGSGPAAIAPLTFGPGNWAMVGNMADTLYFLKPTGNGAKFEHGTIGATQKNWRHHAYFTIRRIAMSVPQRWTIHSGFQMGGPPGSQRAQEYDRSRLYWIVGHKGTYNAFVRPEDSALWHCVYADKTHCAKHLGRFEREKGRPAKRGDPDVDKLLAASFRKTIEHGHMTHTVVCYAGTDCSLMLTMLQMFRWQHYIEVATRVWAPTQWRGDYQPDDGLVHKHSKGKRPTSLVAEEQSVDMGDEVDDEMDDEELAAWSDLTVHQQAEEAAEHQQDQ